MKRIGVWFKTLYYHLLAWKCSKNAHLLSPKQTVKKALTEGKSIIRFGDGEFILMSGAGIHYQEPNKPLQKNLSNILKTYIENPDESNYILCMPNQFLSCNGFKLSKKRVWVSSWAKTRYIFKTKYDLNIEYGDAFLFANGNEDTYSTLWKDKEYVVFVHNNKKYFDFFIERYNKKGLFVKVPEKNSFSDISRIFTEITASIQFPQETVVLLSAGPTSKVLVDRLSNEGVLSIDTGHCWDFPLEKI